MNKPKPPDKTTKVKLKEQTLRELEVLRTLEKHGLITKCTVCHKWILSGHSLCDECADKEGREAYDSTHDIYGSGD